MSHANSKVTEMEIKNQSHSETKAKKRVVDFAADVKDELKKVEWPAKDELIGYTKIVVASMFLFGIAIYFIDLAIQGFLGGVNMLFKIFTG